MIRTYLNSALLTISALAGLALASTATANDRRFAFSYETNTLAKGAFEYEQWATWKHYDGRERFEFRHELEVGIGERDQLSLYLSDWRITDDEGAKTETEWRTAGLSWIHQFSNPATDPIGVATYLEFLGGPEKMVLEGKLLLQKDVGPFSFVYNGIIEAEWEGESYEEEVGVWENTLGVSYQVTPSFLVGIEGLHEVEFAEWEAAGDHLFFVGPNVSFRAGTFFVTTAALFQVSDVDGEPESMVRLLAGFDF